MISVRLKNPEIILTPINDKEKTQIEGEFMGDENLYVLYRLPDSEDIHIGMLSSSMRKYFPGTTNLWNLQHAVNMAYFYNGCSELEARAPQITDRPVYCVSPSDERTVEEYAVLNATADNGLAIKLEDVVNGNFTVDPDSPSFLGPSR